ncbi:VOC family protein [Nakamurella silvestris]|nr:VOC family protein [Nakamurella silvestris]
MSTRSDLLPSTTHMAGVTLKVADLDGMINFYRDGVGLSLLAQTGPLAVLGRAGTTVVTLEHSPELKHAPAGHAGLFHTAVLFEQEADLAASLYSVARRYPRAFTGSADHLVSKAFYFDDPEGNGLELYWDRPRSEWTWSGGEVQMASLVLDPNRFISQSLTDEPTAASVGAAALDIGHVHLKVGDIATGREFYVETMGFEVTANFGTQALFVAAGGYHHHLAMNTWQSHGAGPRFPALGLGQVSVAVPAVDDLQALADRLAHRDVPVEYDGAVLTVRDPWENLVRVEVGQA